MTALDDLILQNTPGNSQGFPLGVPSYYSWYAGDTGNTDSTPPSNFTSVTGWGQVYPEVGQSVVPGSIQVADMETWVHLINGGWVEVQDQATNQIAGAHYVADFSGNANFPWNESAQPDGSAIIDAPASGFNDHFWPGQRGLYDPGTVDGVFVEASMRTTDPSEHYVANVGADWWLSPSAPFVNGFANNPGAGMSNWVELTTNYQQLYFTSMTTAQIQNDLPPPLAGVTTNPPPPPPPPPPPEPPPPEHHHHWWAHQADFHLT